MHVIELLRIQCHPGRRADFLSRDAHVWTPALARHQGFISKEVWPSLDDPDQVTIIVRWATLADWKCFPADLWLELTATMADVQAHTSCEAYEAMT